MKTLFFIFFTICLCVIHFVLDAKGDELLPLKHHYADPSIEGISVTVGAGGFQLDDTLVNVDRMVSIVEGTLKLGSFKSIDVTIDATAPSDNIIVNLTQFLRLANSKSWPYTVTFVAADTKSKAIVRCHANLQDAVDLHLTATGLSRNGHQITLRELDSHLSGSVELKVDGAVFGSKTACKELYSLLVYLNGIAPGGISLRYYRMTLTASPS